MQKSSRTLLQHLAVSRVFCELRFGSFLLPADERALSTEVVVAHCDFPTGCERKWSIL